MTAPDHGVDLLLRAATDHLRPDVDHLVAGGISRGRSRRRRARIGTAVAAVVVCGVIGAAAAVVPQLGSPDAARDSNVASQTSTTTPPAPVEDEQAKKQAVRELRNQPAPITAAIKVDAANFRTVLLAVAPGHQASEALTTPPYPLVDEVDEKVAHFRVDGMLATVVITRSSAALEWECNQGKELGNRSCTQLADGSWQQVWGPDTADQVTAQGVTVWRHGYAISVLSYNAAEGKDMAPLQPAPSLTHDELIGIATSDLWFSGLPAS